MVQKRVPIRSQEFNSAITETHPMGMTAVPGSLTYKDDKFYAVISNKKTVQDRKAKRKKGK